LESFCDYDRKRLLAFIPIRIDHDFISRIVLDVNVTFPGNKVRTSGFRSKRRKGREGKCNGARQRAISEATSRDFFQKAKTTNQSEAFSSRRGVTASAKQQRFSD